MKRKLIFIAISILFFIGAIYYFFLNSPKTYLYSKKEARLVSGYIDNRKESVYLLFLGDIMFDRYIRNIGEKKGYGFIIEKTKKLFEDNHAIIANLEGPITENSSLSSGTTLGEKRNYIFTFDPKIIPVLEKNNIKILNIGNNHISNFGSYGIEQTENFLEQSSLKYFGDPRRLDRRIWIENINGLRLAFLTYNQFEPKSIEKTLEDMASAKSKSDILILYAHWDKEYSSEPMQKTKETAHFFIDKGADLIIGTHPHVIQSQEDYKGKRIYYSLGNFVFDQYFDQNTKKGLAVKVKVDPDTKKMEFEENYIEMQNNGQTVLLNN